MSQPTKFSKSELTARRVLEECGLEDPSLYQMSKIIMGRKAFYEEKPLVGKEGEIVSVGNRSIITVNSNIEFEAKKRFAAAHELGHFEMHRTLKPIFSDTEADMLSWYQGGPHEMEANEFAAEFLMPSEAFYKECEGKKFSPKVIEHLARRFKVSKTAAILKFVKRGNYPVFVVYCKDNKMKWFKKSDDWRYFSLFSSNLTPPTGTVAYEIFNTKKVYLSDELEQPVWKSDWFDTKYDNKEYQFSEYCLFVRVYNYSISVIWEK
jgi:Zn-dependent peptidase ImmA (M78 family)